MVDCIRYLMQYFYDPGISPSSANECIYGNVLLRSNLSRGRSHSTHATLAPGWYGVNTKYIPVLSSKLILWMGHAKREISAPPGIPDTFNHSWATSSEQSKWNSLHPEKPGCTLSPENFFRNRSYGCLWPDQGGFLSAGDRLIYGGCFITRLSCTAHCIIIARFLSLRCGRHAQYQETAVHYCTGAVPT